MRYLAYQETVKNVTYSLYVREIKKEYLYIYDIEAKTLINKKSRTKVAKAITDDCQKSFLLMEMLIQGKITIDDLIPDDNNYDEKSKDNVCYV
ncbi:MAG: hypothetical protein ACI4WH_05085 [Oscillospiraceae bacterium]